MNLKLFRKTLIAKFLPLPSSTKCNLDPWGNIGTLTFCGGGWGGNVNCELHHHSIQMYRGVQVKLHMFLNSAPEGGVWSVSLWAPSLLWTGRWASFDMMVITKITTPARYWSLVVKLMATHFSDWTFPVAESLLYVCRCYECW
jgi:hypothetical protein